MAAVNEPAACATTYLIVNNTKMNTDEVLDNWSDIDCSESDISSEESDIDSSGDDSDNDQVWREVAGE